MELVIEIICLAMTVIGFTVGGICLLKKGKPLYLQLFVIATGCRMLERLIVVVSMLCGVSDGDISVATFVGTFAYALFAFSANYGVMDKVVDDKSNKANKKYRRLALLFPLFLIGPAAFIIVQYIKNYSVYSGILMLVATLPVYGAAYYNFKFAILPEDEMGILKIIRPLNWIAVVAYFVGIINNVINSMLPGTIYASLIHIAVYAFPMVFCLVAVWGDKQWKTLI